MRKALPNSWKTEPLPRKTKSLGYSRIFTENEYQKLAFGLIPVAMEDKWFIYLHHNVWKLKQGAVT